LSSNILSETIINRIRRIRDSLTGIAYHLPERETFLYPFVDNILLFYQGKTVITVWDEQKGNLIFSSLRDPVVLERYSGQPARGEWRVPIYKSPYSIRVHHVNGDGERGIYTYRTEESDHYQLQQLLKAPDTKFSSTFFERLIEAIRHFNPAHNEPSVSPNALNRIELGPDEYSRLLEPMRRVADKIFADLGSSPFFRPKDSRTDLINLFMVVRLAASNKRRFRNKFDYTAGLLLTNKQRESVANLFAGTEYDITQLETMLGPNDRSIADLIFSSGLVAFGAQVRSALDVADFNDDAAVLRHKAEWELYTTVVEGAEYYEKRTDKLFPFYIPIHVGGVPLLALFTFTNEYPGESDEAWKHNYHLYRDVLPRIASQIREGAKQAYTSLLSGELTKHLTLWGLNTISLEQFTQRVSEGWRKISQVYPFDLVKIYPANGSVIRNEDTCFTLDLPDGNPVMVEICPGQTFLRRDVEYDLLTGHNIKPACQEALEMYRHNVQSIQLHSTAYATHVLRTPLELIEGLVMKIDKEVPQKKLISYQVEQLLQLESFANYLVSPSRRGRRSPDKQQARLSELLCEIDSTVDNVISVYRNPSFAGTDALTLIRLLENDDLHKGYESLPRTDSETLVEFYPVPLRAALDGVLSNALRYNHVGAPRLSLNLIISDGAVFFEIANPTSVQDLHARVEEMCQRKNSNDWIGLNIIYLASEVCDFAGPRWTVDEDGSLKAVIQVARVVA
jgi:signal transduction histidine kinase